MGADSTKRRKPEKPHRDFPLFPHANGSWCKKVRGKLCYFGPWDDPDGALARWLEDKDDLLAGRRPRRGRDGATLADACNGFLAAKDRRREAGHLSPRTFTEYVATCKMLVQHFGRERFVDDLHPDEFGSLRLAIAKKWGPVRQTNEIGRVKSVLRFAYESGLVDAPVRTGPEFTRPPARVLRKAKNEAGPKMLTAAEIRAAIEAATPAIKAATLLAVNAGMGNTDVAEIREHHVDLDRGVFDFPRPKTQIQRRGFLWPETVAAIREAMAARPKPRDAADGDRLLLTRQGRAYCRYHVKAGAAVDAMGPEFKKLLKVVGVDRRGVAFYTLRRVFQTVGEGAGDAAAVGRIMGHADPSMAATYRQWSNDDLEDARLRAVAEHVHAWLFPPAEKTKSRQRGA